MKWTARSEIGHVRKNNEDAYFATDEKGGLFIVADGMGGHAAGERASSLATEILSHSLMEDTERTPRTLQEAVMRANAEILLEARQHEELKGMGTTCTLLTVLGEKLLFTNIGDSRLYRLREGRLELLTRDDSFVNYLVELGEITQEEAKNHPNRNMLTRALGTDEHLEVYIEEGEWKKGDRYLLCSDGLSSMVEDGRMEELLQGDDLEAVADALVQEALSEGGRDNITLVLIEME